MPNQTAKIVEDRPFAQKEKLEFLLNKHGVVIGEIASDEKYLADLAGEEKELAAKTDFKNPSSLDALARVRVKRELMPQKISSGREQVKVALDEIRAQCDTVRNLLDDRLDGVYGKLVSDIRAVLRPFCSGHTGGSTQAAHAAANYTSAGIEIEFLRGVVRGTAGQSVFIAAGNLLKIFERVFRVWPDMTFQGERFKVKTVEDLERDELASLLENPEPHILLKLGQSAASPEGTVPLFTRAQAETIVEGRLNYLLSVHPDLASAQTDRRKKSTRQAAQ